MSHKGEARDRERQRNADKAAEIETKFRIYCENNGITVTYELLSQAGSPAYIIWNALDNYVPSTWKGLKGAVQDTGPVQVQAKKALKALELNFATKMAKRPVDFDSLIQEIQKLPSFLGHSKSADNESDMKNMYEMLCLLSGDSFACLKNIASKIGQTAILELEKIQNNLYQQSALSLGLQPGTLRHTVRNMCFSHINGSNDSMKPVTVVEAQPCFIENIQKSFLDYFQKIPELRSISIMDLLSEGSGIDGLQPHLENTQYANDCEIAIYIVNNLSTEKDSYPQVVAFPEDVTYDSRANRKEDASMTQAVAVASDADTQDVSQKIVDLIEYCIDKQLAIPQDKGNSSFYDILTKTIRDVCSQYASTPSFQTGMQEKINALAVEQQSAKQKVTQEYQSRLPAKNSVSEKILPLKIAYTTHALQNKIELLQQYCPQNDVFTLSGNSSAMFATCESDSRSTLPSAPPFEKI